jgi:hypothetical protein
VRVSPESTRSTQKASAEPASATSFWSWIISSCLVVGSVSLPDPVHQDPSGKEERGEQQWAEVGPHAGDHRQG